MTLFLRDQATSSWITSQSILVTLKAMILETGVAMWYRSQYQFRLGTRSERIRPTHLMTKSPAVMRPYRWSPKYEFSNNLLKRIID
jgi:hypothetical protein